MKVLEFSKFLVVNAFFVILVILAYEGAPGFEIGAMSILVIVFSLVQVLAMEYEDHENRTLPAE